jgi:YbbR domain-containing protein
MKSKFLTALLAGLIAVCLWAYVITAERPESENTFYNVPVVLDGEAVLQDRGMMITSDADMTVTLKLSGKRSDLNKLKSSDIAAVVDLSRIAEAGQKKVHYDVSIPGDSTIEVVSRQPDTLTLTVMEWATKEIPVELVYDGRVSEGYYVDKQSASLDYEAVTVTGPKEIINQIEKAKITLNLENRIETISEELRYALCDAEGNPIEDVSSVTTDHGEIRVTVSIQQLKEVRMTYSVVAGGGLTAEDVRVTADYETVTVAGSTAALVGLDEINLGTVDLGQLTESTELVMAIKLPEGVSNQSGYTVVRLQVELPELETRTYSVSKFRTVNVPQGLTAQIYTQLLEVKIRGRGPVLDRLKPEHITAVVDLSGEEAGMFSLPVEFELEGFGTVENIGAIEKYSVTGKLAEPTPEPAAANGPGL